MAVDHGHTWPGRMHTSSHLPVAQLPQPLLPGGRQPRLPPPPPLPPPEPHSDLHTRSPTAAAAAQIKSAGNGSSPHAAPAIAAPTSHASSQAPAATTENEFPSVVLSLYPR